MDKILQFDSPKNQSNVIKVIGVGGGGSNAINHMFQQGIKGVDFIICNTDAQALLNSPVPNKIQLGISLTEGLGAGANPEVGHQSAIESIPEIEKMLDTNTKMVFITAGMGGGTGTGAAPVIAQIAKEKDILTVGIVTIPFKFEGRVRQEQALIGVEKLRKQVDSLIVINNNKLRDVYGDLGFYAGYSKADEVLSTASRGIAEVITHHFTQNIDLRDAKTVLANSGTAIMGSATATGPTRAKDAIISALDSPLLNDNKITGAKNVLLLIVFGDKEITFDEIGDITDYIQDEAGNDANIIMGAGADSTLGDAVMVTIIATGFNIEQQTEIVNIEPKKIIHTLGQDQKITHDLTPKSFTPLDLNKPLNLESESKLIDDSFEIATQNNIVEEVVDYKIIPTTEFIKNLDVKFEIVLPERTQEFNFSTPLTNSVQKTESNIDFVFDQPTSKLNEFEKINQIDVNQAQRIVPVTEINENGIVRYTLEEAIDNSNSKKTNEILNFTVKEVEPIHNQPIDDEISLLDLPIEEAKKRALDNKRKLKQHNHIFDSSNARIEEFEKQTALERSGIKLDDMTTTNPISKTSIGNSGEIRTTNSFLHDLLD